MWTRGSPAMDISLLRRPAWAVVLSIPTIIISLPAWVLPTVWGVNRYCVGAGASSIRHRRRREFVTPSEPTHSIRELLREPHCKDGQALRRMASVPLPVEPLRDLAML